MNKELSLIRMVPDMVSLARWATANGYLAQGCTDLGYGLHAISKAALGNYAPKPFVLRERGRSVELLGYVSQPASQIVELASMPGAKDHDATDALRLEKLTAKAMPSNWRIGLTLSFEVRLRPIVRSRDGRNGASNEVDYAAWINRQDGHVCVPRYQAYINWLGEKMSVYGTTLVSAEVVKWSRTKVLRRPMGENGKRKPSLSEGPDITVKGILKVDDPAAFGSMVARGIGRHTSFGFGCLLLAPAGAFS